MSVQVNRRMSNWCVHVDEASTSDSDLSKLEGAVIKRMDFLRIRIRMRTKNRMIMKIPLSLCCFKDHWLYLEGLCTFV